MIKPLTGVFSAVLLGGMLASTQAASFVVGVWDFDTFDSDAATGTLFTTDGTGQLAAVGNGSFEFGYPAGSSGSGPDNSALHLLAPAGSEAGSQIGADFGLSTLGFQDIQITFDFRHPPLSDLPIRFEYSIDDGNFWTEAALYSPRDDGSWANSNLINLGFEFGAANNSNLRFRVVGDMSSALGTDTVLLELDGVTVTGQPSAVPEPTAVVMGVGLVLLAAGRCFVRR